MEITQTTWVAITAIATCLLTLATIGLAIGVPWSLHMARADARNRFYSELDRIYLDIQKLIIQMPYLSNPRSIKTPEQTIQYGAFAFVTWNFIESIYDYSQQDESLLDTWKCVFLYESSLHREWFDKPENRPKFKKRFVKCIVEGVIK
jgi:hypothetical protein